MSDETKEATNRVTKESLHKTNNVYHSVLDKYLASIEETPALLDPRMLALVDKYLARNDIRATEEDVAALEARRKEIAKLKALKNRKREHTSNLEFFEDLKQKREGMSG